MALSSNAHKIGGHQSPDMPDKDIHVQSRLINLHLIGLMLRSETKGNPSIIRKSSDGGLFRIFNIV
jgi:hypothetical protein